MATASQQVSRRMHSLSAQDASYAEGRVLGSMCTAAHPVALEAFEAFRQANLGDPGHFPGAAQVEREYVDQLFRLAGGHPTQGAGQVTGGATEANLLALTLMRESTGGTEVIVPATGHFSFEKAAKLLGLRLRVAAVDDDYRTDPAAVQALVNKETAGIVAVAGSTQVGSVDPVKQVARVADEASVPLHVDAAFGAYVLPFLPPGHPAAVPFGFDVAGVTSVAVDSHKMGMGVMGAGALLVRDEAHMDHFSVPTPYLSTPRQRGVLGTRSAGPVAAAWAVLETLGEAGFRRVVSDCLSATARLVEGLANAGVAPLVNPPINIVAVPTPNPWSVQRHLAGRGWRVNVLPRLSAIRVVAMPHVTREVVDAFLPDLVDALASVVNTPQEVHAGS